MVLEVQPQLRGDLVEGSVAAISEELIRAPPRHHVDVVVAVEIEVDDRESGMAIERRQAEEPVRLLEGFRVEQHVENDLFMDRALSVCQICFVEGTGQHVCEEGAIGLGQVKTDRLESRDHPGSDLFFRS